MKYLFAAMVAFFTMGSLPAHGQEYPSKPITLIIPFAAGGSTDIAGRILAKEMGEALGQPVVVQNRTGAAGAIGIDAVAKSAPDGYTLGLSGTGASVLLHITGPKPNFTIKDLSFIGNAGNVELMFISHPGSPYRDIRQLIAAAKQKPGKIPFAHGGTGSPAHLTMEYLEASAGIDLIPVAYKGDGALMPDVMAGTVDVGIVAAASPIGQIKAGKITPLGIASAKRSPALPDVPTVAEQGVAGFESAAFNMLAAPAGTPAPIIAKLNGALNQAFARKEVRERFVELGMAPGGGTPKEASDFVERETNKWRKVIQDAKIVVQ
ncbi:MAG: tripartite tricarboxylate transporter substrate binding protein [Rhodocyclaceae bacterium]|nr:tripartite tricarboxylate transporter substrate binding protein [Rhodocyclaceae bacterium]